jgi:hypothetical protein
MLSVDVAATTASDSSDDSLRGPKKEKREKKPRKGSSRKKTKKEPVVSADPNIPFPIGNGWAVPKALIARHLLAFCIGQGRLVRVLKPKPIPSSASKQTTKTPNHVWFAIQRQYDSAAFGSHMAAFVAQHYEATGQGFLPPRRELPHSHSLDEDGFRPRDKVEFRPFSNFPAFRSLYQLLRLQFFEHGFILKGKSRSWLSHSRIREHVIPDLEKDIATESTERGGLIFRVRKEFRMNKKGGREVLIPVKDNDAAALKIWQEQVDNQEFDGGSAWGGNRETSEGMDNVGEGKAETDNDASELDDDFGVDVYPDDDIQPTNLDNYDEWGNPVGVNKIDSPEGDYNDLEATDAMPHVADDDKSPNTRFLPPPPKAKE